MIKNIILDVGGVLIEWEPKVAMKSFGFSDAAIQEINEAIFSPGVWSEEDRSSMNPEQIRAHLIAANPEYASEIGYFYDHANEANWQYDYAKDWIRELKEKGFKVYILSNYGKYLYDKTVNGTLNFLPLVDGTMFSFEAKKVKPEPEIYTALIDRYELNADECLFFDDNADNIEMAIKMGLNASQFTTLKKAKRVIENFGG